MLRNPRLLQLFRQAPNHGNLVRTSLRRNFALQSNIQDTHITARRPLSRAQITRSWRPSPFRTGRQARHNSSKPAPKQEETSRNWTQLTMSERMKEMSKKYGWVVVGIYLGLSALDFPFCFLAVRLFGTERIAAVEHAIMDRFWSLVEKVLPAMKEHREQKEALEAAADKATREVDGAGVIEAANGKQGKHENASIWTQLLLAYGVHKSLIFFRIPITLAITPRVVKTLRKWGWSIGKA